MPGESHGERSPAGYSPQGCKELDTTEMTELSGTQYMGDEVIVYQMPILLLVHKPTEDRGTQLLYNPAWRGQRPGRGHRLGCLELSWPGCGRDKTPQSGPLHAGICSTEAQVQG